MTVTVYSKPACVQCNATYKALDKQGIAYETVDITARRRRPGLRPRPGLPAGTGSRGR